MIARRALMAQSSRLIANKNDETNNDYTHFLIGNDTAGAGPICGT